MQTHALEVGDLLLIKGNSMFSKVVRFATNSQYTHVCVYVGYGMVLDVDGFRTASLRPIPSSGGFELYRLKRELKHFEQDSILVEAMSLIDETKGYDWFEAIKLFLGRLGLQIRRAGRARRHLCTELCLELYRRIGFDIVIESLEPERLAHHDTFRRIFPHVFEEMV
ncbi:hypothetical protein C0431_12290 [bacterium]|nr:hypothetical protein [bacterium]